MMQFKYVIMIYGRFSSDGQHISTKLQLNLFWFEPSEIQLGLKFAVARFVFHVFCALDYENTVI